MKYAVWFVRLVFAAWMIPAGVNHFLPIFPQPMGSQPLSQELISALIDSHLFDIVKAVELFAGICVLTGWFAPLAVLVCMPVSFCVFFWDAPLEGWGSRAALFGYSTLLANVLLCFAYIDSYRSMFARALKSAGAVTLGRLAFGAWMLANGLNHFWLHLWAEPVGHPALAAQLMEAFVHSGLLDVAMAIELVAGALLLAGALVPVALCVLMPVSVCALYWSVVLEHRPLGALLAIIAFALNAWLMFANLSHYRGVLARRALTLGESQADAGRGDIYDLLYAAPMGRTARALFVPALVTLLVAVAFFFFLVKSRTGQFCMLVLVIPAIVLLARRLRDMGYNPWLAAVPAVLLLLHFAIRLYGVSLGASLTPLAPIIAVVVSAGFALWGCLGNSRAARARSN